LDHKKYLFWLTDSQQLQHIVDLINVRFKCLCAVCNIFRLLQISSFNGKMNALNEVNKLIANVTYNLHKHGQGELDEWLTAEKVAVCESLILRILLAF